MLYNGIVNSEYGYANAAGTIMILLGVAVMALINRLFRMNERLY
jgi:raffinose/stachyose/melibiose transport system permease protein